MSDVGPSYGSPSPDPDDGRVDFASVAASGLEPSMSQKKCSNCGEHGHNKRTCTQQPPGQHSRSSASAAEDQSANGSNADEIRQDAAKANGEKEVTAVQFRDWLRGMQRIVQYKCFQEPAGGVQWWQEFRSRLQNIRPSQLEESMAMEKLKDLLDKVCSFLLVQKAEHKQRLQDFKDRSDVNAGMLQEYANSFCEIVHKEFPELYSGGPRNPKIPKPGPRGKKGSSNEKAKRDRQQGAQIDQNPGTESGTHGGDDDAASDDRSRKRPCCASLANDTGGGSSSRDHAGTSGPGRTDDAGPSQGTPQIRCWDCKQKHLAAKFCREDCKHTGPNWQDDVRDRPTGQSAGGASMAGAASQHDAAVQARNDTSDRHAQSFECAQCKSSTDKGKVAVFLECCGARVCTTRRCRSPEECEKCKGNKPCFHAHWLSNRTCDGCAKTQEQAVGHCTGCKKDLCDTCSRHHNKRKNNPCSDEAFPVGANVAKDFERKVVYCESHKEYLTLKEYFIHSQKPLQCNSARNFEEKQGLTSVPGMADLTAHKQESINLLREGDEVADFVKNKTGEELQKRKAAQKKIVADLKTELLQLVESCAGAAESRIEGSYSSELASSELAESRMKKYKENALCHSNLVAQDELVERAASDSRERALPLVLSKKFAALNRDGIKPAKLALDEVKQSLISQLPPATDPPPAQDVRTAIQTLFKLVGARPPAPSPAQPAPPDNTAQTTRTPSGVGGSGGAGRSGAAGAGGLGLAIAVATAGNTHSHDTQSLPAQLSARSRPSSP